MLFLFVLNSVIFAQTEKITKSGLETASFDVFSESYDNYQNPFFWNQSSVKKISVYSGIYDTSMNIACAGFMSPKLYGAFSYTEKISNYKWWPQNMTDESWTFLLGWENFMLKGGYYDFCYSEGKGTAEPYLFFGKNWDLKQYILGVTVGVDVAMQFVGGSKMDVYQNTGHLLAFYGNDSTNGITFEYKITGTYPAKHNVTNVQNVPFLHRISSSYAKVWQILPELKAGIHPAFYTEINAVNPTVKLNNFLPGKSQFDFYFALPLALEFYPSNQDLFSIITSFKMDIYYASFDHLGYDGIGSDNYSGWVPGIGLGFGCNFDFSDKGSSNIGLNYTACPNVTENFSKNEYDIKAISVHALLESPITVSLCLNF